MNPKKLWLVSSIFFSALAPFSASAAVEPSSASPSIKQRTLNYTPDDRAFLCINGHNRYTRALYGSHSDYRLETSDRPIFAVFKKNHHRNIRFLVSDGKITLPLDSADYCEARYVQGRRDYIIRDPRLGKGDIEISAISDFDREGAVWRISASGFPKPLILQAVVSNTAASRFSRNGDITRIEKPGGFEPKQGEPPLQTESFTLPAGGNPVFIAMDLDTISPVSGKELASRYEKARSHAALMTSALTFNTPDPWLNTMGDALMAAADGAWDGETWLHGAVGWRSQIPGWRAAYMGDFLGMPERQRSHFEAYAKSQVTDVPVTRPHLMDSVHNLSRGTYEWGTPMYSNGYICRTPGRNNQFHHYDMNLVFIDELLTHFQFDADTAFMRQMWPVLKSHLAWEKQAWDPDGDSLYDAYCCIWASDALQYESGAGTHSSAYNYRGNLLAARIAEIIGEDPEPYRREADNILKAMDKTLWLPQGHWAEFKDFLGQKRLHESAALWSVYTPIDCGACSPEQAFYATRYVDRKIPHIPFAADGKVYTAISTTDWAPYEWSINNVAMAESMHTALAYYKAGRPEAAYSILKGNVMDFMYLGSSPANFGQISTLDRSIGEAYRDFSDVTSMSARAMIEGLFGISPEALDGRVIIRPGFPADWDHASIHTPYLDYSFERKEGKEVFSVTQNFSRPLRIVIRRNLDNGRFEDIDLGDAKTVSVSLDPTGYVELPPEAPAVQPKASGTALAGVDSGKCRPLDISSSFNSSVTDIFRNEYLSPRSPYTTLALPKQGIGDWCSTKLTADIDDSGIRELARKGDPVFAGIPFSTPAEGSNIAFASLWDNYPDSISIPLKGKGRNLYLLMAGSTNPMQSRFDNGEIHVEYTDGSTESLTLRNPDNWCPIEQDYDHDGLAFNLPQPRPYRVGLASGEVSRTLAGEEQPLTIKGGAAQILEIPLDPSKSLKRLNLSATANDVVIGIMAVTLQQ